MRTSVNKIVMPNYSTRCFMCDSKNNLYRITIADIKLESLYFLPICKQCAKELVDEIMTAMGVDE